MTRRGPAAGADGTGRPPRPAPAARTTTGRAFRTLSAAMFRGFVRDRAALFFSLLFPVLFLVLFGSIYRGAGTPKITVTEVGRVSVLDHAVAASHGELASTLTLSRSASRAAALARVRRGDTDAAVWQHGRTLVVRYSAADPTTAGVANAVFSSIVQHANQAASGRPPAYRLAAQQAGDASLKPIQYITPGLLGWAVASSGAFAAAITLVGWRERKLLRRLRLAPMRTSSVVTARIAVSVAMGVAQLFLFLGIASTPYFGLRLTAWWWLSVPLVICGTLAFLAIGLLVGALVKSQQAATALANLIILPMAFLGGAFIPLDFAPRWLQQVSYAMPLRYLVVGMQNVMARGEGPVSTLPAMGILLAFAAVLTVIAVRLFRWDEV